MSEERSHEIEIKIAPDSSPLQGVFSLSCNFRVTIGRVVFPQFGTLYLMNKEKKAIDPGMRAESPPYLLRRAALSLIKDVGVGRANWEEYWEKKGWEINVSLSYTKGFMENELRFMFSRDKWENEDDPACAVDKVHVEPPLGIEYGEVEKRKHPTPSSFKDVVKESVPPEAVYALLRRDKGLLPDTFSLFHALFHLKEIRMLWNVSPTSTGWRTKLRRFEEIP